MNVDDAETRKLTREWEASDVTVPLKVVASPYREVTGPVLDYVRRISKEAPRTVVTVFVPEYVVGHWWEGRKPAFVDDLVGLLVGPMFVVAEWLFAAGWDRPLAAEIELLAATVTAPP